MKTKHYILTILSVICFVMINPAFAQKTKDVEAKVKAMTQKAAKMMMEGKFSTDGYTEDAIQLPSNSPMVVGLDALKASYDQMASMGIKFEKVEFVTTKVIVDGNTAIEIGTYDMSMTMPNMPDAMNDKGKYLTVYEIQKDGSLKIKVETWNTDLPPPGMN